MTRAKFRVSSITRSAAYEWVNGQKIQKEVNTVHLHPVGSDSEENKKFFASTPNGRIELAVINPEAAAAFELDGEYYVDFTPAS